MTELREWMHLLTEIFTLIGIWWAALKVVAVAEKKVDEHERRISSLEKTREYDANLFSDLVKQIAGVAGKMDIMVSEIGRVRDRLDRFVDAKATAGAD